MKFAVDENIPYIAGRLEPLGEVIYLDQNAFTPERVADRDALLIRTRTRCNKALLEGSRTRLVATATIGVDQIDIPWCESAGITVCNSPGCNAPAVAQYVWAAVNCLLTGGDGVADLSGKRVGVVGCGHVGGIVADWGRRFGADVVVSDPPRERAGFADNYLPLDELLATSDIITLHTPLTRTGEDATFHLIGERELSLLKDGAILVNAARGPVVDSKALKEAVCSPADGRGLLRTIIDTWEGEPALDEDLLRLVDIGTFHIAGYSREGKERATRMVLEAVERRFGVSVDKSGLEGDYRPDPELTLADVAASYDPRVDHRALLASPGAFEQLRHDYDYRKEACRR